LVALLTDADRAAALGRVPGLAFDGIFLLVFLPVARTGTDGTGWDRLPFASRFDPAGFIAFSVAGRTTCGNHFFQRSEIASPGSLSAHSAIAMAATMKITNKVAKIPMINPKLCYPPISWADYTNA
jgi:hypothetical protein